MSHNQEFASEQWWCGPGVAVKETYLVPDGYSFRCADLNDWRSERFQVSIVVSRNNLYVRNNIDETLKEFRDVLPFFQLNFCDGVFHVSEKYELSGMSVVYDLAELVEQTRDL